MKIVGLAGSVVGAFIGAILLLFIFCCIVIGRDK